MSRVPTHPFFVARIGLETGCGHCHATQNQAHNCAVNLLSQHPLIEHARVVRISQRKSGPADDPLSTVVEEVSRP